MNIEDVREFCLSLNAATESFPFDETTLVFKVGGKMFCLTDLEGELSVNIKNVPEKNIQLREEFSSVSPGYHMNKQFWNTVKINGTIPDSLIKEWIRESYQIIVDSLPKSKQNEINILNQQK